jgi:hypothetical protein
MTISRVNIVKIYYIFTIYTIQFSKKFHLFLAVLAPNPHRILSTWDDNIFVKSSQFFF